MSKECRLCREIKELTEFGRDIKAPDKLKYYCKKCTSNLKLIYRERNRERLNADERAYYRANKAAILKKRKDRLNEQRKVLPEVQGS